MHIATAILLAAVAAASAWSLGAVPYAFIFSAVAGVLVELLYSCAVDKRARVSLSAAITGMIIGGVAPFNAPLLPLLLADTAAIMSKFLIKAKGRNVFNPAALGLLTGLGLFSLGDEWWAASGLALYGIVIPFSVALVFAAYKSRRLIASFSFIAFTFAAAVLLDYNPTSMVAGLLGLNYFFAFIMVAEPKTSPYRPLGQVAYGGGIALLYLLFGAATLPYPFFAALLIGNAALALHRVLVRRHDARIT